MNCKLYRTEIEESGLDAATTAPRLESHLRECDACREFYEERAALRRLLGNLEPVSAPPDFDFRLRARLAAEKSTPARALFRPGFAPGTTSVAVLACLVLGITLFWRLVPTPPTGANAESTAQRIAVSEKKPGETKPGETLRASADVEASKRAGATETQRVDEKNTSQTSPKSLPHVTVASAQAQRRVRPSRVQFGVASMASAASKRDDARGTGTAAKEAPGSSLESRDFAEMSAPRLRIGEPLMLPVGASAKPLKILLRDEGGASRMVALQPVSFGAQQFGGRLGNATATTRTPLPSREGVW